MSSKAENDAATADIGGFWTGEMIRDQRATLFDPPRDDGVDCAAYTLRMGSEVYISPTDGDIDAKNTTVRTLAQKESFTIPPGQFAFLLTEEIVSVPPTVLAFISMKAKVKWRGLINVSGFHVDPGFKGRLVFAVFNAGPVVVHLRRGDDLFLIWFADLKAPTKLPREKPPQLHITSELINGISGELQSLPGLNTKLKTVEKTLGDRVHAVEKSQEGVKTLLTILITLAGALLIGLAVAILKGAFAPEAASNTASTAAVVGANAQPVNLLPTNIVSESAADTHTLGASGLNILERPAAAPGDKPSEHQ